MPFFLPGTDGTNEGDLNSRLQVYNKKQQDNNMRKGTPKDFHKKRRGKTRQSKSTGQVRGTIENICTT